MSNIKNLSILKLRMLLQSMILFGIGVNNVDSIKTYI